MKNKSKIKIAAQVRPNPSEEDIAFIKELGLDYVTLFAGKGEANYDFFMTQREIFETNDLKIYGFGNSNIHNHASLVLNLNDREEVIEFFIQHMHIWLMVFGVLLKSQQEVVQWEGHLI